MIQTQWGRKGDQATFYLSYDPTIVTVSPAPVLSQILVYDVTNSLTIFAGLISNPMTYFIAPTLHSLEIQCQGFQPYLAKAVTISTWSGITGGQVLMNILNPSAQGVTPYGVKAQSVTNGGFIYDDAPGLGYGAGSANNPYLGIVSFNGTTIQDVLTQLQKLVSVTEVWGSYVDYSGNLHFEPGLAKAPVASITDQELSTVSATEGNFAWDSQAYYQFDASDMRNNIILTGSGISQRASEKFIVGVGGPPWTLLFNPSQTSGTSRVTVRTPTQVYQEQVQGYSQPLVATVGPYANPAQTDFQYYVEGGVTYLGLGLLLNSGSYIPGTLTNAELSLGSEVTFSYTYPAVVLGTVPAPYIQEGANPYTGPNNGVWTEIINDSNLGNINSIQNRGMREIVEYGYPQESFYFTVSEAFLGIINAGDIITISAQFAPDSTNGYTLGLTDNFMVTESNISASQNGAGYRTHQLTALRLFML